MREVYPTILEAPERTVLGELCQISEDMIYMAYYSLITGLGALVISERYQEVHGGGGHGVRP